MDQNFACIDKFKKANHTSFQEVLMQMYTTFAIIQLHHQLFNLSIKVILAELEGGRATPIFTTSFAVLAYMSVNLYGDIPFGIAITEKLMKQSYISDHCQCLDDLACYNILFSYPIKDQLKFAVQYPFRIAMLLGGSCSLPPSLPPLL